MEMDRSMVFLESKRRFDVTHGISGKVRFDGVVSAI
jgi:hypothetical protein